MSAMSDDYWRGQVDARLEAILSRLEGLADEKAAAHAEIEATNNSLSRRVDKLESRWDRALGILVGVGVGAGAAGGAAGALVSSLVGG